jgi:hypothetical protein
MDRVGALIHKLKEQYDQNVDKNNLLVTVQLLLAELQYTETENLNKGKVSVTLPKVHRIVQDIPSVELEKKEEAFVPVSESEIKEVIEDKPQAVEQKAPEQERELPETIRSYVLKPPPQPIQPSRFVPQEVKPEPIPEPKKEEPVAVPQPEVKLEPEIKPAPVEPPVVKQATKKEEQSGWLFDPIKEDIPTLRQHKEVYELNDVHIDSNSLNDKLKEEKKEVGASIKGDTVADLRKAIGINDRYRYINELFRGDEAMYERSIKTINSCNSFAEADSWIQRELKVKMGWNEKSETTKDFDQVVKRRFS